MASRRGKKMGCAEDITLVWDADGQMVHLKDFPTIELIKTILSSHQHTVRATLCGTYESAEFSLLTKLKGNSTLQVDWNCNSTL